MSKRKSNIELLRIVSMLMIVTMHFLGHGGVIRSFDDVSAIQLICEFINGMCRVAVNCFILISGYFLIESKFKCEKVIKLGVEIWFYSILIYLILTLTGMVKVSFKDLIYAIFPISTNSDAFSIEYIIMYLLSPFMNIMIKGMDKKQFKSLMKILILFFVVLPGVFCFMGETIPYGWCYGVMWFLILYLAGAYIRKNGVSLTKKDSILFYLFTALLVPGSSIGASILYKLTNREVFWNFKELFYSYNSVLVFTASVALFVMMLNLKVENEKINRVISFFAPTTFGIYLIHDNRFIRNILWEHLNPAQFNNNVFKFVYWFVVIISIFLICAFLDKLRNKVFNYFYRSSMYLSIQKRLNN